jgi:hypothetical protein
MARARGTPRDANPYRRQPHPGANAASITRHVTAEERLAARLETAWRIGWEAVDRELSNGPAQAPVFRRTTRPGNGAGGS